MKLNNVINFILSMIFLVSKCCTDYIFNWLLIIISYVSPFASVPPTPPQNLFQFLYSSCLKMFQ